MKKKILMLAMLSASSVLCMHCVGVDADGVVRIPAGCKYIESEAFIGKNITRVEFESGSNLETIDARAFYGCSSLESVILPETLKCIGEGAFANCVAIKKVVITSSVRRIGDSAFANCSNMTSITLPSASLTEIGSYAFANCSSLKSIVIPEGVIHIGKTAFEECPAQITIPSTIDHNGSAGAFLNCKAKEIKINFDSCAIEATLDPFPLPRKKLREELLVFHKYLQFHPPCPQHFHTRRPIAWSPFGATKAPQILHRLLQRVWLAREAP
jgi:hypothetical protein